uniref:Isthmin 2a n=1 Tax=Fundulus heteroclitus TaxID=8078 RepID=A0A3Q2QZK0_FUNHE
MGWREALHVLLLVLAAGSLRGLPTESSPQSRAKERRDHLNLEHHEEQNLLQTLPSPSSSTYRHHWSQHRRQNPLPPPASQLEPETFVLDLSNIPDLANADVGSQNPNIQVTIEVMEDSQTETEVEMDLAKENQRNDWSVSSPEWINSHSKLFWPLFWEYPEQLEKKLGRTSSEEQSEVYSYDPGDPILSEEGTDLGRRWNKDWGTKDNFEYEDWSNWTPCSVTCGSGSQKRTRPCGYACTATESRTCDLQSCPKAVITAAEAESVQTTNSTDRSVDSCEKWLSCKNEFLQKYLHQVLTTLPSCPCSYPAEVIYSAINIQDSKLRRNYRWRDASGPKERLDIYKPSARFCIRSMLSYDSTTLGAQHCCYDSHMRLMTRGKGAGSPNLISTEFSPELHYKVDILPWILCKGDWSRFHSVRPPNNGLECMENPPEAVFQMELKEAQEY